MRLQNFKPELATLIRGTLSTNFGDWGAGVAVALRYSLHLPLLPKRREGLITWRVVKYFSPAASTGIIRVGREHYRLVWAALTYVPELKGGRPCLLVHVSGTIKKAELETVRGAKKDISLAQGSTAQAGWFD
ncbi:Rpp14/Pop5 family-domain-containing protein [Sphaerosporella brunnea]|uniref:Rpp14/Pop5 family-domain-containing protein n=1 Tax=Sphaerosporella brunnea TaxID=1250544 RepID=A0A5J5ESR7_9PEZI|nr:Rpp14/Pop5 family-domain-containing protein [Sphaerosporella brunnea]